MIHALLNIVDDGLLAVDQELRYTVWNRGMEAITGLAAADVLGQRAPDLFPFLAETGVLDAYERSLAGETVELRDVAYAVAATGRSGFYDAKYGPMRDASGAINGAVAVIRETTDLKRAEARVAETERRFQHMADSSPVLLWMAGTDSLCTFFNKTWLDFTGRSLAEEWGVGWAEGVHPEDFQRCVDHYEASFGARRPFEMEYRLRRHDGQYRWILDRGTPRYEPDGTFAGYIGSCVDITERKEIEAELRHSLRVRDDFLSIASHELRTPLSTLRLQAESMVMSFERGRPVDTSRSLARWRGVLAQVDRLEILVETLLDVSRLRAGRIELHLEPVDLAVVVRDVCTRAGEDLAQARCAVTVEVHGDVRGHWDRLRLEQVVTNLLSNAAKYGRGQPIDLVLDGDDDVARLRVVDHGIGIAPEDHARIFDRFERAVSERSYGGLGLGLWITRQIVDALGGTITVRSQLGHGASFTVELPRRPAVAERGVA